MRRPVQLSRSSSAAVLPMSAVATIGIGWSSGCRKVETTPAFAASTSQLAFSMNQAARRKATGTDTVRRPSSVILELFSRLYSATWAPTVDRKTIFAGCAVAMAALTAAIASCVSGKPGSGSKSGGVMRNTPSTLENAQVRPAASEIEAIAISQPFSAHVRPLSASRTTALTGSPAANSTRATMPPTLPVIPVMAYTLRPFLTRGHLAEKASISTPARLRAPRSPNRSINTDAKLKGTTNSNSLNCESLPQAAWGLGAIDRAILS